MFGSVRVRLALWYAAVLALSLVAFAVAGYQFLRHVSAQRIDEVLSETASAFAGAVQSERAEGRAPSLSASQVVSEFRLRDIGVVVYDAARHVVLATSTPPHAQALHPGAERLPRRGDAVRIVPRASDSASVASADSLAAVPPDTDLDLPADTGSGARQVRDLLVRVVADSAAARAGAFATVAGPASPVRVFALPFRLGPQTLVITVSQSLAGQQRILRQTRVAILLAIPFALVLATVGGYVLARKSLAPVVQMSAQAARIGATNLHERLPVANERDELGQLARVFNDLLGRLDHSFDRQRQFMADASHELRTPVSIVRGEAELALGRTDRAPDEYRDALAVVRDEAARLTQIVDDLFLLARADAGEQPLVPTTLDLGELAGDAVRAVRSLAERQGVAVRFAAGPEVPVRGDAGLLARLVRNLLDNAIKYTPAGGEVRVRVDGDDGGPARVVVTDSGPGIPPEAQPRIFDRFYRVHKARGNGDGGAPSGAGLGLAIARWVAEVHGGTLRLARSDERGSEFVAELPAA